MEPSIIPYKVLPDDLLHRLEEHFIMTQVPDLHPEAVAQCANALVNAEGPLSSSETVNTVLLERMSRLRATSMISVGYGNFGVDALNTRKVLLVHTPTMLTETIVDTVMVLMLSTAHRVMEVVGRVEVGEWTKSIGPDWFGTDVHHKASGIVGMDRIGLTPAQRTYPGFSVLVLYDTCRRHQEAEECFNARHCDLDTPLQESDFVYLTLPLIDETHHLFSTEQFAKMKSSATFINAGRGPMVDKKALIVALQKGEIHAAGLDIFEREPLPVDSSLLSLPNMAIVPHIGPATHGARYNMAACMVDNLVNTPQGHVEKNCVNPQVAS